MQLFSLTQCSPGPKQAIKAILSLFNKVAVNTCGYMKKTNILNVQTDKTVTSQSPNEHVDTLF